MKTATANIDLNALAHNLSVIKYKAENSKVLAVLKANAYGHGLARIAKALSQYKVQADAFGVARIDEALELRSEGVSKPIVLLEGFFSELDLPVLAVNNLQTVVHNREQLNAILDAELTEPLKIWLKVDTGMHRLGVNAEEFDEFYHALNQSENVHKDIIIMSHFSCADDLTSERTNAQLRVFSSITKSLPNEKTLANSAAICAWPESHYDWIRPGLMLYGVSPMQNADRDDLAIQPVMNLQSSVIAIRQIKKNEAVGYGAAWVAKEDTTIGVIAIGYGDGYPRHAQNGTPVLLNGRIVPLVGRVSMDMITVDLGNSCQDKIGDIATLWGQGLPVEEVAKHSTTIPYELLCNITRRVHMGIL
ncbi:alanine racemase [Thalassotalea sp. M1531]|uniref:Alanine racemase n=1 Tax=Thalassotalea algicola TaxID=2716224 RepID=A0A7Y0Q7X0_9GAMM|nr:alanine racemase [Thalassotalea algicola]NMP33529.1 alanine racemase [Thalassotalea algicola]